MIATAKLIPCERHLIHRFRMRVNEGFIPTAQLHPKAIAAPALLSRVLRGRNKLS